MTCIPWRHNEDPGQLTAKSFNPRWEGVWFCCLEFMDCYHIIPLDA
jgi:hypothetical protein